MSREQGGPSPKEMGIRQESRFEHFGEPEEIEIKSAKEGVEKSKEIIGEILEYIGEAEKIASQYVKEIERGDFSDAIKISKRMTLVAELSRVFANIDKRQQGWSENYRHGDGFTLAMMMPGKEWIENIDQHLRYNVDDWKINEELGKLKGVVNNAWEMMDKEQYIAE